MLKKLYRKNIKINWKSININYGVKLQVSKLSYLIPERATDVRLSGKAFHALAAMY